MIGDEYNHELLLGKIYERGMLPYGGAVDSHGRIVYAVPEEQFRNEMNRLNSIL